MTQPIYEIRDLTKEYLGRRVLEIDTLDINRGEMITLVGPSGAGKSTFLRLLNFLETQTSGTITFESVNYLPASEVPLSVRRRVTTVFQRPILLNQNVIENVIYGLRLRGRRDSMGSAHAVIGKVGLTSLATSPARTLSGGEAQRVALARAMIIQPDVLLLDEPTANLDPYNVSLIEDIVHKLNHEMGTTIILVTHNVFQAKRLASRVALLLDGRLIEISPTDKFFNEPQDPRTQAFLRGDLVY